VRMYPKRRKEGSDAATNSLNCGSAKFSDMGTFSFPSLGATLGHN
jgi:hypothetical protein